ncbi:MAG TPA: cation diffusion facilitator family transporter, partial [Vicinamibacteria bacterium]|nr:cation diffusion facilitator family transporter [Vicinamibacteria bacterium]
YGHRKFETAATGLIGLALLTLAWEVLSGALARASHPALPEIRLLNWVVMGATIGVNAFVSWYESREGRRLRSAFLVADATHTRADLYVSLGVMASFGAALAGLGWADPLVAVAIAAIIAWQAGQILLSAFDVLTDRAVIPAEMLEPLAAAVPGVLRVHDVRSRGRRDAVYVDLTVHLDGGMSLHHAHDVADRIEAELERAHPEIVDVVVHLEPEGHEGGPARA